MPNLVKHRLIFCRSDSRRLPSWPVGSAGAGLGLGTSRWRRDLLPPTGGTTGVKKGGSANSGRRVGFEGSAAGKSDRGRAGVVYRNSTLWLYLGWVTRFKYAIYGLGGR